MKLLFAFAQHSVLYFFEGLGVIIFLFILYVIVAPHLGSFKKAVGISFLPIVGTWLLISVCASSSPICWNNRVAPVYYTNKGGTISATYVGEKIADNGSMRLEYVFKTRDGHLLFFNKKVTTWRSEKSQKNVFDTSNFYITHRSRNIKTLSRNKTYIISYQYVELQKKYKKTSIYPKYALIHISGFTKQNSVINASPKTKLNNLPSTTLLKVIRDSN